MKPEDKERIVSEALNSYPLAPLPDGFTAKVIAGIKPQPVWRRGLVWFEHLSFLPTALWGFLVGFLGLIVFLTWWSYSLISPIPLYLFRNQVNYWPLWARLDISPRQFPTLLSLVGVCIGMVLLFTFTWVATDPRRRHPAVQ